MCICKDFDKLHVTVIVYFVDERHIKVNLHLTGHTLYIDIRLIIKLHLCKNIFDPYKKKRTCSSKRLKNFLLILC